MIHLVLMSIMAENKLLQLILKYLIDKHAYSLAFYEEQEDKCLCLEYRNVYDVSELNKICSQNGIEIGDCSLSMCVSRLMQDTRSPMCALQRMRDVGRNDYFFIGEILRLHLKDRQIVDIAKIDKDRWWITYATGKYNELCASFIKLEQEIGSGVTLNSLGLSIEIESVDFLVPTDIFMHIDVALFPSYYCMKAPEDFSLEEILIKPLYREIINAHTNRIGFSSWRCIAENAYKNGMDSKTIWYISNAVAQNHKRMYLWS